MRSELLRSLDGFRYVILGCGIIIALLLVFLFWFREIKRQLAVGKTADTRPGAIGLLTFPIIISGYVVVEKLLESAAAHSLSIAGGLFLISFGIIAGFLFIEVLEKIDPYRNAPEEQRRALLLRTYPIIISIGSIFIILQPVIGIKTWSPQILIGFLSFAVGCILYGIVMVARTKPITKLNL